MYYKTRLKIIKFKHPVRVAFLGTCFSFSDASGYCCQSNLLKLVLLCASLGALKVDFFSIYVTFESFKSEIFKFITLTRWPNQMKNLEKLWQSLVVDWYVFSFYYLN